MKQTNQIKIVALMLANFISFMAGLEIEKRYGIPTQQLQQLMKKEKQHNQTEKTVVKTETSQSSSWYAYDTDDDGKYDLLTTHNREVIGNDDALEKTVLAIAQQADEYKIELAEQAGRKNVAPSYLHIEDFDGDGKADLIAWPNITEMPYYVSEKFVASYEAQFPPNFLQIEIMPNDMREKASKIIPLENIVKAYIRAHL